MFLEVQKIVVGHHRLSLQTQSNQLTNWVATSHKIEYNISRRLAFLHSSMDSKLIQDESLCRVIARGEEFGI